MTFPRRQPGEYGAEHRWLEQKRGRSLPPHGEVARRLRQATHPTKIVFLTLMAGDDFIREANRYGHGFVAKSRLYSDLVPALYTAIEAKFCVSDLNNR
jgi:hypothetical protein